MELQVVIIGSKSGKDRKKENCKSVCFATGVGVYESITAMRNHSRGYKKLETSR